MFVVGDQSSDEDASGSRAETVHASVGDVDAGVMPTRRDLVKHAFVIRDQDAGGADYHGIPLKGAHRERRLDDVEFVFADSFDCRSQ